MSDRTRCYIGIFLPTPAIERFIQESRTVSDDVLLTSSASFYEAVEVAREWEKQGVEVVISRRGTGDLLRKSVATPVLSLPFSELEILRNLRNDCPKGKRVLVTMYGEENPSLNDLAELLDITILQGVYNTRDELETVVKSASKSQVDMVAGGGATKRFALLYGFPCVELPPSREQVQNILESARNVAAATREKEVQANELLCMMNSIADGLLSVDSSGVILNLNDSALKLLRRKSVEEVVGTSFTDYIGETEFRSLLQDGRDEQDIIAGLHGASLFMSATQIKSKHSVERLLVTLRKPQDVIRQSGTLRSFISRGFVANYHLRDVIYKSRHMHDIIELCKAYAQTNASILIYGETGTGKEMLSQGIHNCSNRRKKAFVSVNCAELPEHLLESELFGYSEGAFTGSRKGGKEGFFELAHTGTILLDEIDSASRLVQSKLLRVLQEKEIMRIGGTRKIPVDVRVLATSGQNLWEQVHAGNFRKDLFFRLNVMSIRVPPLRDRIEDIKALLSFFMEHFSSREGVTKPTLSEERLGLLNEYTWPGNVRQLRSFVERYVLHATFMEDPFSLLYNEILPITIEHCPASADIFQAQQHQERTLQRDEIGRLFPHAPPEIVDRRQAMETPEMLWEVLASLRYSKKDAARYLGVSRTTLWRRMKQWGIN